MAPQVALKLKTISKAAGDEYRADCVKENPTGEPRGANGNAYPATTAKLLAGLYDHIK